MDFPHVYLFTIGLDELVITRLDAGHYVLADGRTVPQIAATPSAEDADTALMLWFDRRHPAQIAARKDELRRSLAARRYHAEVVGITVAGVPVATDRDGRAMLHGALTIAQLAPGFQTDWKCPDGIFRVVDQPTITAWVAAVATHVQRCFAREAELLDLITLAGDTEDFDQVAAEIEGFKCPPW